MTGEGGSARPEPHVVIVGGGFGGLYAAFALHRQPVRVTLVDRHNYHLFQPLLYQVATAGLSPGDIAQPIRNILRRSPNISVVLAEATAVDTRARRVVLADGVLAYDDLILATGASHAYIDHDEWRPFAPGLKDLDDALEIRRRTLLAFEAAERESDETRRRAWLTFVIVGGGPTGVELAGTLAEIARHALREDFRRIDPGQARILVLEARACSRPASRNRSADPPRGNWQGSGSRSARARPSRVSPPASSRRARPGSPPRPSCGRQG